MTAETPSYSKKDFQTDQLVRWCPGCGDYSILAQVQSVFSDLGLPREQFAVIAGIGCSSRFPYYMQTYGFHTIHGRAPAFATGLKCTRPELSVWLVTGDGDGLSIGGNHLIHLFRRNVDLQVMLFNNRIYGLTKGQYSPTSEVGKRTKSTPFGSIDNPFNPLTLALGAGATFVARSIDRFPKHLQATLTTAHEHRGTSFTEIYQNCNIFNDGAFLGFTERDVRDERVLYLEPGERMIWGKESRRGLKLNGFDLEVVDLPEGADESEIVVHDPTSLPLAHLLAQIDGNGELPLPVGVIYRIEKPTYDSAFRDQIEAATKKLGQGDLASLLNTSDTWTVEG